MRGPCGVYVLWEYIVQSAHGVWMAKTKTFYQPFYLLRLKSVSFVEKRKIASLLEISLIKMDKSDARKIPLVALFLYLYIGAIGMAFLFRFASHSHTSAHRSYNKLIKPKRNEREDVFFYMCICIFLMRRPHRRKLWTVSLKNYLICHIMQVTISFIMRVITEF